MDILSSPSDDEQREYKLKVIVIGEPATGKTAIIERYTKNIFTGTYRNTVCYIYLIRILVNQQNILGWC